MWLTPMRAPPVGELRLWHSEADDAATDEYGSRRYGDVRKVLQARGGAIQGLADERNDGAEVLAQANFRYHYAYTFP